MALVGRAKACTFAPCPPQTRALWAAGTRFALCPPHPLPLPLEELVRGRALRLLFHLVGLEPRDLVLEERDAVVQFLNREQSQVLPDLVHELFLRAFLVVECRHGGENTPSPGRLSHPRPPSMRSGKQRQRP